MPLGSARVPWGLQDSGYIHMTMTLHCKIVFKSSFSIYWNTVSCSKRLEFWDPKKEPENTSERCRYWVPLQTFSDSASRQLVLDMSKPNKLVVQQSQVETRRCMFHPQCDVTTTHAGWRLHCWLCQLPFHHTFCTFSTRGRGNKYLQILKMDSFWCTCVTERQRENCP